MILTVRVRITDKAAIDNSTERKRTNAEGLDVEGFFGQEDRVNKLFAKGATGKGLVDLGSSSSSKGEAQ